MHALDAIVSRFHLLKHPFYQRWMEGGLSKEELRRYAVHYYPHVAAFPTYVSAVHSLSNDSKLRQDLLENLIEEERGEENHPELWLRFAEAMGVSRESVADTTAIPESTDLVETFRKLSRKSVAAGLGALYAYESQVPMIAEQKICGLEQHYGIKEERALQFFRVHIEADKHHSATARRAIDRMELEERREAEKAAEEASQALWNFLSGLDRLTEVRQKAA